MGRPPFFPNSNGEKLGKALESLGVPVCVRVTLPQRHGRS